MRGNLLAILLTGFSSALLADPFAKGNPKIGKTLADKACIACHAALYEGDSTKIYTRPNRKVKTAEGLLAQVKACSTNTGTGWFSEEELHVAAYLNQQYYQFK